MTLNKDKVFTIIRIVISIVGSILLGQNIGEVQVDQNFIQMALGIALGLAAMVWSFIDQTSTIEAFQATLMQTFLFVGGLLVASGAVDPEKLETWGGIVAMLGSVIYPILSRKKSQAVAEGKIPIEALKGVNEDGAPQKPITPVLEMEPPKTEDNSQLPKF